MASGTRSSDERTTPLSATHMLRPPARPIPYWFARRWWEIWLGWRDGRVDRKSFFRSVAAPSLADARHPGAAAPDQASSAEMYLYWTAHEFYERDWHELLIASASVAPIRRQLIDASAKLESIGEALAQAELKLADTPVKPAEDTLRRRRPAEKSDDERVVMARRQREHERVVARLADDVRAKQAAYDQLRESVRVVREGLVTVFDATQTRSMRLREHYERRRGVYLRAYLRVVLRKSPGVSLAHLTVAIAPPAWISQPCPWTQTSEEP